MFISYTCKQFGTKLKLVVKMLDTNFGFVPDWLDGIFVMKVEIMHQTCISGTFC